MTNDTPEQPAIDPEVLKKVGQLRTALQMNFGRAVLSMAMLPRYRSQMLSDLSHLVLDPLIQDRLVFAYTTKGETETQEAAGFAIWASVSPEVDARIREQVKAGVFPIRLKRDDWNSGEISWLLDVVAADPRTTASVIANFSKVANKDRELHLHPMVSRLVEPEVLERMGARRSDPAAQQATEERENATTH